MSAAMGTPYSPPSPPATSSSATMSPTMSPIYPDRPIRPLPKRSLKERLSSEAAEAISYPPAPPSIHAPFQIPYSEAIAQRNGSLIKGVLHEADKAMYPAHKQPVENDKGAYRFRGNELASEDGGDVRPQHQMFQQRQGKVMTNGHSYSQEKSHSVASSNDSADGYDSFENTNNKKKRKIPTSGNPSSSMPGSLSQDLANMGISNEEESVDRADNGVSHYYSTTAGGNLSGTGISGPGRGRYGRNGRREISGRLPLHSSANGSNAWPNGKVPVSGRATLAKAGSTNGDKGIISQAIADAAALQSLSHGQENVSLLEQQMQKKSPPVNSHFTFTYESESSNKPAWPKDNTMPGANPSSDHAMPPPLNGHGTLASQQQRRKDFNSHGTQTPHHDGALPGQDTQGTQTAESPRKPRRPASRRYAIAARERRAQQEYNNYHHPPKEEDFWICEFCEYESIFGRPPEALIRQYEMKDEKERKRQAEKRRLLEKAKMKGRKGKKGKGKGANSNNVAGNHNNATAATQTQPAYDPAMSGQYPAYGHAPEEDYYGEQYDEPGPTPELSPEPATRIPQPVNHTPGQSARMATHSHVKQTRQVH